MSVGCCVSDVLPRVWASWDVVCWPLGSVGQILQQADRCGEQDLVFLSSSWPALQLPDLHKGTAPKRGALW